MGEVERVEFVGRALLHTIEARAAQLLLQFFVRKKEAERFTRSGDTRGNSWYTDLVCLSVDATVPTSDASQAAIAPSSASIKLN